MLFGNIHFYVPVPLMALVYKGAILDVKDFEKSG